MASGSNRSRRLQIGLLSSDGGAGGGAGLPELCSAAARHRGWLSRRSWARFGLRAGAKEQGRRA